MTVILLNSSKKVTNNSRIIQELTVFMTGNTYFMFYNQIIIKPKARSSSCIHVGVRVMVFNVTFNNISVISWRSVLFVDETGVPGENHRPVASH